MGKSENLVGMAKGQILNKLKPGSNGTTGSIRHGNVVNLLAGQLSKPQAVIEAAIKELIRDGKVSVEGKVPYITCLRLSDAASEERAPFIPTTPEQKRQSRHAVDPRGYGYPSTIRPGNPHYRDDLVERNATPEEWLAMGHPADTYPFSEPEVQAIESIQTTEGQNSIDWLQHFVLDLFKQSGSDQLVRAEVAKLAAEARGIKEATMGIYLSELASRGVIVTRRVISSEPGVTPPVLGQTLIELGTGEARKRRVFSKTAVQLEHMKRLLRDASLASSDGKLKMHPIIKQVAQELAISENMANYLKRLLLEDEFIVSDGKYYVRLGNTLGYRDKLNMALDAVRDVGIGNSGIYKAVEAKTGYSYESVNTHVMRPLRVVGAYATTGGRLSSVQDGPLSDEQFQAIREYKLLLQLRESPEGNAEAEPEAVPEVVSMYQIAQQGFAELRQQSSAAEAVLTQEVVAETQQVAAGVTDQVVAFDDLLRRLTQRVNDLKGQNAALSEQCSLLQQHHDDKVLQLEDLTLRVEALELALALERERLAPPQAVLTPQVDPDTYAKALSMLED